MTSASEQLKASNAPLSFNNENILTKYSGLKGTFTSTKEYRTYRKAESIFLNDIDAMKEDERSFISRRFPFLPDLLAFLSSSTFSQPWKTFSSREMAIRIRLGKCERANKIARSHNIDFHNPKLWNVNEIHSFRSQYQFEGLSYGGFRVISDKLNHLLRNGPWLVRPETKMWSNLGTVKFAFRIDTLERQFVDVYRSRLDSAIDDWHARCLKRLDELIPVYEEKHRLATKQAERIRKLEAEKAEQKRIEAEEAEQKRKSEEDRKRKLEAEEAERKRLENIERDRINGIRSKQEQLISKCKENDMDEKFVEAFQRHLANSEFVCEWEDVLHRIWIPLGKPKRNNHSWGIEEEWILSTFDWEKDASALEAHISTQKSATLEELRNQFDRPALSHVLWSDENTSIHQKLVFYGRFVKFLNEPEFFGLQTEVMFDFIVLESPKFEHLKALFLRLLDENTPVETCSDILRRLIRGEDEAFVLADAGIAFQG